MALKITANADYVVKLAADCGRLDQFGYKGWRLLAEAMEQLSDGLGEDIEVDIIGWCCEYSHARDVEEAFEELQHYPEWGIEQADWEEMYDKAKLEAIEDFLQGHSTVMVLESDCIIWANF